MTSAIAFIKTRSPLAPAQWQKVGCPRKDSAYQLPMREALLTHFLGCLSLCLRASAQFSRQLHPGTTVQNVWKIRAAKHSSCSLLARSSSPSFSHEGRQKRRQNVDERLDGEHVTPRIPSRRDRFDEETRELLRALFEAFRPK